LLDKSDAEICVVQLGHVHFMFWYSMKQKFIQGAQLKSLRKIWEYKNSKFCLKSTLNQIKTLFAITELFANFEAKHHR
jgi:hypothetical protein